MAVSNEENEEHKRSPLLPRVFVKDRKGRLRERAESGEIEVPFELYKQWCRICSYREKTLTPYEEYLEQLSEFDRKPMKIVCGAANRCVHLQKLMNEWKEKHGYV